MYFAGVLSARLRLVAAQQGPSERGKTLFLAELGKMGVHWLSTAQGLFGLGSAQAHRHGLLCFCEQVVMVHRQCGSGLPF
jgi:hypothetical protein